MLKVFKDLLGSKKFWTAVVGSAVVAGLEFAGAPKELIYVVGTLFGLTVGGQGLADFGKEAAKDSNRYK